MNQLNRKVRHWPRIAMVGYIDCSSTGAVQAITKEEVQSYNVIIFGFTDTNGDGMSLQNTISRIQGMESEGTLNLVSIGGAAFKPTKLSARDVAENLMRTVRQLNLDGVDLDIEDPHIEISYIEELAQHLRKACDAEGHLLTCAPILAGDNQKPTLNTPNGGPSWLPLYGAEVKLFDAINVQAYNSGSSFTYQDPVTGESVSEASPDIVCAGYTALQSRGDINPGTKIVMGIPCNAMSANQASNCWQPEIPAQQTAEQLVANVNYIVDGDYQINPEMFGGLMTWSITNDAYFSEPRGYFSQQVAAKVLPL